MTRQEFLKRLKIQEKIEGKTENIALCKVIIEHLETSNDLRAFFNVKHHRYGTLSYEAHTFYYVKENIKQLFEKIKK